MQEFDHIQSLWQSHSVEVKISSEEMLAQAKKEVAAVRNRSLLNICGMVLSFIAFVALLFIFQSGSWAANTGLIVIIISVGLSTVILYQDYRIIANSDFTVHPAEFLLKLKAYQLNKFRIYNRLYWLYALALSLGSILYFYDTLSTLDIILQIAITVFTIFWMVLCATVLRRSYIKREKERIDLLIEKIERISGQLKGQ